MKYILLLVFLIPATLCQAQTIRVLDKDSAEKGVICEIKVEKTDGKLETVSFTDTNGWVMQEIKCSSPEKVIFIPRGDYYKTKKRCPVSEQKIFVSSTKYGKNLLHNAGRSFKSGDFGTAALAYSEAATRVRADDEQLSIQAEEQAYLAAGKAFGVEKPVTFDQQQGKNVMSPELRTILTIYKTENDMTPSGHLDFETLSSLTDKKVRELMIKMPEK